MRLTKGLASEAVLSLTAAVIPAQSQVDEPPSSGVYVRDSTGWMSLEPIRWAGGETERADRVLIPGLPPQLFVWMFRGAHAPVKIKDSSVQLFIREVPGFDDRNVLLVKFDVKKDQRELQSIGGNFLTFKSGFSKERAPEFQIHKVSDHTFSVTPKEALPPGEYMITISPGVNGYCFSVSGNQSERP